MCALYSIPGAGQISSSFSLRFFFCSIFPIFSPYTPHESYNMDIYTGCVRIITPTCIYTVNITVLSLVSCRVLASMYTHYNTILCSRVNLTGKAHYYLLLLQFFFECVHIMYSNY